MENQALEPSARAASDGQRRGARATAKRVALGALTTLIAVNLWSGGPLLALWVGSRVQTAVGALSMAAVGVTVGTLIVESVILYKALAYLNAAYSRAIGRPIRRQQSAWLKPMSGERQSPAATRPLTAPERIVVGSVVVVLLALEVWFFVFAHYRIAG